MHKRGIHVLREGVRILNTLLHQVNHPFLPLPQAAIAPAVNASSRDLKPFKSPATLHRGSKLFEAMGAEARSKLHGLPGTWDLNCQQHRGTGLDRERRVLERFEREALVRTELDRRAGRSGNQ